VTPEGLQRGSWDDVFQYRVPDLSGCNRESSATDGGKSNWRHNQPIVFGSARRPAVVVNGPNRPTVVRDCGGLYDSTASWNKIEPPNTAYRCRYVQFDSTATIDCIASEVWRFQFYWRCEAICTQCNVILTNLAHSRRKLHGKISIFFCSKMHHVFLFIRIFCFWSSFVFANCKKQRNAAILKLWHARYRL